jgi:hypothetical protein
VFFRHSCGIRIENLDAQRRAGLERSGTNFANSEFAAQ